LKSYTPKEVIALLLLHGFEWVRTKGSHQIYVNYQTGKRTVVPMHAKDLKKGTFYGILKQAGIDPKELD
jgi:mRNA interferase HicA